MARTGRPSRTNKKFPEGQPRTGLPKPRIRKSPKPKPKPKGGRLPPTPVPKGIPRTPLTEVDPITAMYAPMFQYYNDVMAGINSRAHRDAAAAEQSARAFADYYLKNAPGQISGVYNQAASNQSAFAKGFSQAFTQSQTELADQANAIMGTAGAPAGQQIETGPQMGGDVAYALGGFIPSGMLGQQGAAFGAAAALQPPAIFAQGQLRAQEIQDAARKELDPILGGIAQLQSDKAKAYFDAQQAAAEGQSAASKNAMQLYNAGVITQAELAALLGLPGKYPNTKKATAETKLTFRSVGNTIIAFDPITGKGTVVYQGPEDPKTKVIKGIIYQYDETKRKWVPVAGPGEPAPTKVINGTIYAQTPDGQWVPAGGPGPTPGRLQKGPNGSVFDPNTGTYWRNGKPYLPPIKKGGTGGSGYYDPSTGVELSNSEVYDQVQTVRKTIAGAKKRGKTFEQLLQALQNEGIFEQFYVPMVIQAYGLPVRASRAQLKKLADTANKLPGDKNKQATDNAFLKLRRLAQLFGWQPTEDEEANAYDLVNYILNARPGPKPEAVPRGGGTTKNASFSVSGSGENIAQLWIQAGGDPSVANLAAAVAMGESGGVPTARLHTSREDSRGLWQINTYAHPWAKKLNLNDPLTNAKAAVRVWRDNGKTFNPWSAYTNGRYKKYYTSGSQQVSFEAPDGQPPRGIAEMFYDPRGAWDDTNQWISPIGGHSDHVHLSFRDRATAVAAMKLAISMGLHVGENPFYDHVDPVHVHDSYHYRNFSGRVNGKKVGMAADISGTAAQMSAFWDAIMRGLRAPRHREGVV